MDPHYLPQGHGATDEERAIVGYHDPQWTADEVGTRPHHHIEIQPASEDNAPANVIFDD